MVTYWRFCFDFFLEGGGEGGGEEFFSVDQFALFEKFAKSNTHFLVLDLCNICINIL